MCYDLSINTLTGKTLISIEMNELHDELIFVEDNGKKWKLYHTQDCCEIVQIEEIIGDLDDLLNTPIIMANEEYSEKDISSESAKHETWTFYKFRTIKGSVTIRWYGASNGYYSETANFKEITNEEDD